MSARPSELLAIVDQATAVDEDFANSVSDATWADYRARLAEYEAWLTANDHSVDSWEVAGNFAAFLAGLGRSTVVKHRTAIAKLVAAHHILDQPVTNPATAGAVAAVLAKAAPATGIKIDGIDPGETYRIGEAARALEVSERTVRRRLDDGSFPDAELEPSRTGQAWTIPGHNLIAAFTTTDQPAHEVSAPDFDRVLATPDASIPAGARDLAILHLVLSTDLPEAHIGRLVVSDIDPELRTIGDTPLSTGVVAVVDRWRSQLLVAGAGPSTTLWTAVNKGGRINLDSHPVRIGDVVRRRCTEAGSPVSGVAALRDAVQGVVGER